MRDFTEIKYFSSFPELQNFDKKNYLFLSERGKSNIMRGKAKNKTIIIITTTTMEEQTAV